MAFVDGLESPDFGERVLRTTLHLIEELSIDIREQHGDNSFTEHEAEALNCAVQIMIAEGILEPNAAVVAGCNGLRHGQTLLPQRLQQPPFGECPHPLLARPHIAVLPQSRHAAAAAEMAQRPLLRTRGNEPSRAAAAGDRDQFTAPAPELRIEQGLRGARRQIAKAGRIRQHGARSSSNASAFYHFIR